MPAPVTKTISLVIISCITSVIQLSIFFDYTSNKNDLSTQNQNWNNGYIFLIPTSKITYVNMQEKYVDMQDSNVWMRDNYVKNSPVNV